MHSEQFLKDKIMRRVHAWHLIRTLTSPVAKTAVLATTFTVIAASVSIKNVAINFANALQTPGSLVSFVVDAFVSTEFAVQLFASLALVLGAILIRDFCMACFTGRLFAPFHHHA